MPSVPITKRSRDITGFHVSDGVLENRFFHVDSVSEPKRALGNFMFWVDRQGQEVVLYAHNAKNYFTDVLAHNLKGSSAYVSPRKTRSDSFQTRCGIEASFLSLQASSV